MRWIRWSLVIVDARVFMTVAVDLVIAGIQEPVRFLIETKAKVFPTNERFWYFNKKMHIEEFLFELKEVKVYTCILFFLCSVAIGWLSPLISF